MTSNCEFTKFTRQYNSYGGIFDLASMTSDLQRINEQMAEPDFWADQSSAQQVISRKQVLERELTRWTTLDRRDQDLQIFLQLVEAEDADDELGDITQELVSLEDELALVRTQMLLSEDKDINNAIVSFHPGAGGTESQDWAEMRIADEVLLICCPPAPLALNVSMRRSFSSIVTSTPSSISG